MALNLFEVTNGTDGPDAIYAAHSEREAVTAFINDNGGSDADADAKVRATIVPPGKLLRVVVDADKGSVVEVTARELAADARPGQLVVAGGILC